MHRSIAAIIGDLAERSGFPLTRQHLLGNRRLWALATAAIAALLLMFWRRAAGPPGVGPVWTRIESSGEMRICLDPSFPPFESTDPNTESLVGFDIDLSEELARRLGVSASFVPVGFDGLYDALMANACDLVLSAFPYDPRQTEDFVFSVAYFNAGQVLVVPVAGEEAGSLADLAGQVVAVEWGSDGDVTVRRWGQRIPLTPYPAETPAEALQAVADEGARAAVVDAISAYTFVRQHPSLAVSATVTEDNYVAVMRPDAYTFVGYVNGVLMDMREDSFLERLHARWF